MMMYGRFAAQYIARNEDGSVEGLIAPMQAAA